MNKVQIFEDIHKGYQQNDPELVNACITPIIQEYGREHPIMGYIWGCVYFNALSHEEVSWAGELNQDTVYDHVFRDSFRLDQIFDALLGYIKSDLSSDDQLIGKIVDRLRELSEYQGAERYADYNAFCITIHKSFRELLLIGADKTDENRQAILSYLNEGLSVVFHPSVTEWSDHKFHGQRMIPLLPLLHQVPRLHETVQEFINFWGELHREKRNLINKYDHADFYADRLKLMSELIGPVHVSKYMYSAIDLHDIGKYEDQFVKAGNLLSRKQVEKQFPQAEQARLRKTIGKTFVEALGQSRNLGDFWKANSTLVLENIDQLANLTKELQDVTAHVFDEYGGTTIVNLNWCSNDHSPQGEKLVQHIANALSANVLQHAGTTAEKRLLSVDYRFLQAMPVKTDLIKKFLSVV